MNAKIIEEFENLIRQYKISKIPENKFRVSAYTRAIELIKAHKGKITKSSNVKGLTKGASEKVDKIIKGIPISSNVVIENELEKVTGIGPTMANKIYKKTGIHTVAALRKNKKLLETLPHMAQIGVKYFEGLSKSITKKELEQTRTNIENIILRGVNPQCEVILAGSYYYKKMATSYSDIDIIVTSPKLKTRTEVKKFGLMEKTIAALFQKGFLIDTFINGSEKYIGITSNVHHIDLHVVAYENLDYHLLYFGSGVTESKRLRSLAKRKGYKLNEYGLWNLTNGKRVKISAKEAVKMLT